MSGRRRLTSVVAAAVLVVAGCGDQTQPSAPAPSSTVPPASEPAANEATPPASPSVDYEQLMYGYSYRPETGLAGGDLTIADWRGSRQLNPLFSGQLANRPLFGATMRTLFLVTADGHWKSDLANRMPSLSDGTIRPDPSGPGFEIDLELRPGLRWSDGQPATMDDLESTWTYVRSVAQAGGAGADWAKIDRIQVVDGTHATVHFSQSDAAYLRVLASYFLPAHYLATVPPSDAASNLYPYSADIARAVTIGPFKYATIAGNDVGLVRDGNWHGPSAACPGRACLDQLTYRIFPNDKAGMIAAFNKGTVDVALGLSDTDGSAMASADTGTGTTIVEPAWLYEHFDMNEAGRGRGHGHRALRDVVVRRAIAQAIDRAALLREVYASGLAAPAGVDPVACTNATPTNYWQLPDPGCPVFDVAAANRALDGAGYTRGADGIRIDPATGQKLEFEHCTTATPFRERGGRFLARAFEAIGIKLHLNIVDSHQVMFAAWAAVAADTRCNLAHGNFDTAEFSYGLVFDPHDNDYYPYHSSQIPTAANGGNGFNFLRYTNASVDAAIERLGTALDPADQIAAAYDVQRSYVADAPEIALYDRSEVRGISANLRNFLTHPGASLGSGTDTWNVEDWWLGD